MSAVDKTPVERDVAVADVVDAAGNETEVVTAQVVTNAPPGDSGTKTLWSTLACCSDTG